MSAAYCAAVATGMPELLEFVDKAVAEDLLSEHRRLADDLELLDSLQRNEPDSPDIEPLASALVARIQQLLEREDRVLYQPLLRIAAARESEPRPPAAESTHEG